MIDLPSNNPAVRILIKSHQKTACHNGGNDWHENVTEHFNETLDYISLSLFFFLRLFLQCSQLFLHFIADHVHNTGTKYNLELGLCEKHSLYPFQVTDCLLVSQPVIPELKTKSGGTMGN